MLHEIRLAITFEEDIDEKTAKILKRSTLGSRLIAFSMVVHAEVYIECPRCIVMTIRADLSHDMAQSIKKIKLNHKMVNIPKIVITEVLGVCRIDAPAKIKYIMEYENESSRT